jgi:diguanylate cyclase (GGDEF)-like protein/PAS domain S-box-containing protein
LASLYDQTPTATLLCDRDGRILRANAAAEALIGRTAGELIGQSVAGLTEEGEPLRGAIASAANGGRHRFELSLVQRDGASEPVDCDVFPARIGDAFAGAFVHLRSEAAALADAFTGLPNRMLLADRVEQTLVTARRYSYRFALMHADIDGFREIGARAGSAGSDDVVRIVAQRIREALRRSDTLARVGADRFVVLQPMVESEDDAIDLAHKIVFSMQAPVTVQGRALDVRLSIGIAIFPADGESGDELAGAAERALREAKRYYRGLFRLATRSDLEPAT